MRETGLDLTNQQEYVLIRWVQTENGRLKDWAFEELVKRYQRMIYKLAHKYQFKDYEWVDKVNVFTSCLYQAVLTFDERKETKLSTHYYQVVRHEVFLINQHQQSKKRGGVGIHQAKEEAGEDTLPWLHVSTEVLIKDDLKTFTERSNPMESPYQGLMNQLILNAVDELIQQEKDELNQYLLRGYLFEGLSIQTMANQLGFKHSNASQRLHRALGRLKGKLVQQGWGF